MGCGRQGWRRASLLALATVALLLAAAPSAQAQFGVDPDDWIAQAFGTDAEIFDVASSQYGTPGIYDQAGGHPWKGITDFTMRLDGSGNVQGGNPSRVRVDVPVGLVPNPTIFPRCPKAVFQAGACLPDTQIGIEEIEIKEGAVVARVQVPLYNLEIAPDELSVFALSAADAAPLVPAIGSLAGLNPTYIVGGVRDQPSEFGPHDTGLFFTIDDVPTSPAIRRSKLTFWGVPGDPVHNAQRDQACATVLEPVALPPACAGGGLPHTNPDLPFLSNPTHCTGTSQITRLSLWQPPQPATSSPTTAVTTSTPTIDGKQGAQHCDLVPFGAGLEVTPDTTQPDSPTGPRVRLSTPQPGLQDKDVLTTSHVKDVSVTLPPGMTLNPSAANGLAACSDAQLAANPGAVGGDDCPEASKVGTVAVKSPLLPDAVTGFAFVGQPLAGDMYRLFVTLEGRGVSIRLKGSVRPDANTGQLTATFANNPEQPFDTFDVDFEDGSRAPLATPLDCGPKTASATFAPWSGTAPVGASGGFTIAGSCPAGFAPTLGARTASSTAGAFSPLTVSIARPDRNQFLSTVRVDTPPGLGAIVKGMSKCASALAATGACPANTRIGTAVTRSGAGSEPFRLDGPVYFTGGYKGAPFGMVAVVRAIAGPYDLGTVVVRQSIFVDPDDGHVTVVSDPLPQILEGVPIRLRTIDVTLDRRNFLYNPTSCGSKATGATLHSVQGTVARPAAASFDIARCQALGFKPRMKMSLTGRRQLKFGRHPGLKVRVTQPARQANIERARVVLPLSLALDPANARAICGFEAGLKAKCPAKSRIGFASAVSPALNRPVKGPVYFVQGIRIDPTTGNRIRTLPSLLVKLRGEVGINLRGATEVVRRRLVSTFQKVPDAPVSRFDLKLKGGRGGILAVVAKRGVCARRQVSKAAFGGQNGKRAAFRVKMSKPCKAKRKPKRR